jgi:mitochondrial pyruvate carrier 2
MEILRIHKLTPGTISLAAVNFFLGCVGLVQVSRILVYRSATKESANEATKDIATETKDAAV